MDVVGWDGYGKFNSDMGNYGSQTTIHEPGRRLEAAELSRGQVDDMMSEAREFAVLALRG